MYTNIAKGIHLIPLTGSVWYIEYLCLPFPFHDPSLFYFFPTIFVAFFHSSPHYIWLLCLVCCVPPSLLFHPHSIPSLHLCSSPIETPQCRIESDNSWMGSVSQWDIKQHTLPHYSMTKPGKRRCVTELADNQTYRQMDILVHHKALPATSRQAYQNLIKNKTWNSQTNPFSPLVFCTNDNSF